MKKGTRVTIYLMNFDNEKSESFLFSFANSKLLNFNGVRGSIREANTCLDHWLTLFKSKFLNHFLFSPIILTQIYQ